MVLLLLIRVYDVSKISLILGECCEAIAIHAKGSAIVYYVYIIYILP